MSPTTIVGKIQNGKVVVEVPPDWPEGGEVWVHPIDPPGSIVVFTPETIAARLAQLDEWAKEVTPFLSSEQLSVYEQERAEEVADLRARLAEIETGGRGPTG
ncbi:MAG: hypothetical protein K2X82_01640 [Gemmataceae bacterium]|nr:hypothetical protein [Gemmataceae bacterium]